MHAHRAHDKLVAGPWGKPAMQSKAGTVADYLMGLAPERRAPIEAVRNTIRANLDKGYEEGMQYGMIGYYVPHRLFAAGYHCDPKQPVPFVALASQKNYTSLYLMGVYCGCTEAADGETAEARWFREAWTKAGKKLDMGKCCVRFKKLEDLPLVLVAEALRKWTVEEFIANYQAALSAPSLSGCCGPAALAARCAHCPPKCPATAARCPGAARR